MYVHIYVYIAVLGIKPQCLICARQSSTGSACPEGIFMLQIVSKDGEPAFSLVKENCLLRNITKSPQKSQLEK